MGFQQGVSGLLSATADLDVISNNIANNATVGFKKSDTAFSDIYAGSLIGVGSRVAAVNQSFATGTMTTTSNPLDFAINGQGFFQLRDDSGNIFYSRNGQFELDKDNNIVNSTNGMMLMGYGATGTPPAVTPTGQTAPLKVLGTSVPATKTTKGTMVVNLNASNPTIATPFNPANPSTYNYANNITAYDSLGNQHNITLYFTRTALNTVRVNAVDTSIPVVPPATPTVQNLGNMTFDTSGMLTAPFTPAIAIAALNGSAADSMDLNFAGSLQQGFGSATTSNTPGDTVSSSQNGAYAGLFTGIAVSDNGTIQAKYSNGQELPIGQIVLANFANPQGLIRQGNNVWQTSLDSGAALLGVAGVGNVGSLKSMVLESSNVDLAQEMVKMIVSQRWYQANTKTIQSQSDILSYLMSIHA